MVKSAISLVVACISGAVIFIYVFQTSVLQGKTNLSEPSKTIDSFWQFSLLGSSDKVNELLTKIPSDYYDMTNKCADISGKTAQILNAKHDGFFMIRKGVGENQTEFEAKMLNNLSSEIKHQSYKFREFKEIRKSDKDAVIEVTFGKTTFLPYKNLFLLRKENGEWKIFMSTNMEDLEKDNKYFASVDCSDMAVVSLEH